MSWLDRNIDNEPVGVVPETLPTRAQRLPDEACGSIGSQDIAARQFMLFAGLISFDADCNVIRSVGDFYG